MWTIGPLYLNTSNLSHTLNLFSITVATATFQAWSSTSFIHLTSKYWVTTWYQAVDYEKWNFFFLELQDNQGNIFCSKIYRLSDSLLQSYFCTVGLNSIRICKSGFLNLDTAYILSQIICCYVHCIVFIRIPASTQYILVASILLSTSPPWLW